MCLIHEIFNHINWLFRCFLERVVSVSPSPDPLPRCSTLSIRCGPVVAVSPGEVPGWICREVLKFCPTQQFSFGESFFWVRTSPKLWVLWAVGRVKCLSDLVTRTVLLLMICILFFSKFGWQFQSSLILKRTMYYGSQQNPNRSIQDVRFFRTLKTPTKNSCFSAILALSLEVDATLKKLLEHNAYKTQTHKSTNIHRIFTHLGMFINHAI